MNTALDIIEALQCGDTFIFKEVFETYHRKLYQNIFSKTRSSYLAEEVVQLTFIKFWEYRSRISREYALSTQLYRIAATTLVDVLRKQYADDRKLKARAAAGSPVSEAAGILVDEKDFQATLRRAMAVLPGMRRRAFEMNKLDGMTYREIAAALSISEKAVENHIYKATRQIKALLANDYYPFFIVFSILCMGGEGNRCL
jgi:RNA polymerase sigma factor (sigma-70 family)